MTGFDATFLALACGFLVKSGKRRSLIALTPLAVFLIQLLPVAAVQQPLIAVAAIVLSGPQLAAAAVLALPNYETIYEAAAVAILWWTLSELMDLLESGHGPLLQSRTDSAPSRNAEIRTSSPGSAHARLPLKVMIVGVLYLVLYPLALL